MATHSHFPSIHSPLSTPFPLFHFHHHKKILSCYSHQTIFCSSASLTKKFRGSRKVKSEEELRNDIKEFLSIVGLPHDHLPSTNELSNHGRQDLANIVRRRGYKFIRELLGIQIDKESEKMKDLADDISSSSDSIEMRPIEDLVEATIESGFEILKKSPLEDSTESTKSSDAVKLRSDSAHGTHEDLAFSGADGSDLSNGHVTLSSHPVEHPAWKINASRTEILSNEKVMVVNHNEDPDVKAQDAEKQAELNRLKYILHQKEKELTKLKEQIEKEKHALFLSQSKAEKETSESQKLISEKDDELHAAEESLSGLKEVEIRYRGEGETVEVAGSFNGWHQNIKMEPLLSSSIVDLTGLLKSRSWSTVLWLYPGVHEIKFIVDGNWTLDLQRELVTRGHIHNNILRVDR